MFFKFKPKNIYEVLEKLYPKNIYVFRENKIDKRFYFDFFLSYFDISKLELTQKITELTSVKYIEEIPEVDAKFVKNAMLLDKYCFCPTFDKEGNITSFISSDPFSLKTKFDIDKKTPVFLSTAKNILKKIEGFSKNIVVENNSEEEKITDDKQKKSIDVLSFIIFELEQKNISNVLFEKQEKELFYSYKGNDNLWKKGTISNKISDTMLYLLENAKFEGVFFLERNLQVKKESSFLFSVSWEIPKEIQNCQKSIAFLTKDIELAQNFSNILKKQLIFTKHFEEISELYNDASFENEKVLLIDEDELENFKKESESISKKNENLKKIVIGSLKKSEIDAYTMGVDFYIDKMSSCDYICEIIKSLL